MGSLAPPQPANRAAEFVNKLNRKYNLNLRVIDLSLSPSKRREALKTEEDELAEDIHSQIRWLASQRPDALEKIEREFDKGARVLCGNWVTKPRAASGLLPVTPAAPRASNAVERRQLWKCLLNIVEPYRYDHGKQPRAQNRQAQQPKHQKGLPDESLRDHYNRPIPPDVSPSKKAKPALDRVPSVWGTSNQANRRNETTAIPLNRSFGFRNNLAAAKPPAYHSFSDPPPPAPRETGTGPSRRPPSPSPFYRVSVAATKPPVPRGGRSLNSESANTSVTTHNSTLFSFPRQDDSSSVSTQETVPNDDREEYKVYRPQSPTRLDATEATATVTNVVSSEFTVPPITSSGELQLIALGPTASERDGLRISGVSLTRTEAANDSALPSLPPDDDIWGCAEASIAIRERGPNASAPSFPPSESSDWVADFNSQEPIYGAPAVFDGPSNSQPLTLEDRLNSSWREYP